MEHKFGISCLNSGPVLCKVSLNHGGYVPGETILVSARIRNRSKIHIKSTKASLREVTFHIIVLVHAHKERKPFDAEIGELFNMIKCCRQYNTW